MEAKGPVPEARKKGRGETERPGKAPHLGAFLRKTGLNPGAFLTDEKGPMPIPFLQPPAEAERTLRVVSPAEAPEGPPKFLVSRGFAHAIDISLVTGMGLYFSHLFSLLLISFHMKSIQTAGRGASSLFREVYAHGHGALFFGLLLAFSLIYFVVLPALVGRTLGQALLGLCVSTKEGGRPTWKQFSVRFAGCLLLYFSGGVLGLMGLRRGSFVHEEASETYLNLYR
jgi:hypothetical protein